MDCSDGWIYGLCWRWRWRGRDEGETLTHTLSHRSRGESGTVKYAADGNGRDHSSEEVGM